MNAELNAATAAHSSTGALTSLRAQVYMLQGSPFYNREKGRALYNQAITSLSEPS